MGRPPRYDYRSVARRLSTTDWYLLAENEKHTVAEAIRQGKVVALRGAQVRTRNTHYDARGRVCDIYLRATKEGGS